MAKVKLSVYLLLASLCSLVACDSGKTPYQQAVALEEAGQLKGAADAFESVCRRFPDSDFCNPARAGADRVRSKLADRSIANASAAITAFHFEDAATLLDELKASKDIDRTHRDKAAALLDSPAMQFGREWEKASALSDKHQALPLIEKVAASGVPVADRAQQWLRAERPALLLDEAQRACVTSPPPSKACLETSNRLLSLHAGTPEANQARTLLDAVQAAEQVRAYPILVELDKMISQCKDLHVQYEAFSAAQHNCQLAHLAADENAVIGALAACGDAQPILDRQEKLQSQWNTVFKSLGNDSPHTDEVLDRWRAACDKGEYERWAPPIPPAAGAKSKGP